MSRAGRTRRRASRTRGRLSRRSVQAWIMPIRSGNRALRNSDSVRIFRIRADVVDVRCDRTARGAGGVLNSQIGEDEHRTVHVRRRGLRALELAIDVEADLVGLPVDTISVIPGWIGCLTHILLENS